MEELKQEETTDLANEVEGEQREEQKVFLVSQEELTRIATIAAQEGAAKGIEAYKAEQETSRLEKLEKARYCSKTLLIHYRRLKRMKDTAVTDAESVTDPTLSEIFEMLLEKVRKEEFDLTSTSRMKIVTGMLMNHVDVQLENYRKECEKSDIPEVGRRYRVVEMMYLIEKPLKAEAVAEEECIDKSNVYRTLEKAYDDLAVLFFGIEGLKVSEIKPKRKKKVKSGAKNTH